MAHLMREYAVNTDGTIVAVADSDKIVHIWDVQTSTKLKSIQTNLDLWGRRLAISADGSLFAVGAYHRYGLSLYSTIDGTLLWNRTDLKKVQIVDFNMPDGNVIAGFDDRPLHILDLVTGNTLETIRGVRAKWSLSNDVYLLEKTEWLDLFRNNLFIASIKKISFAVLSVAFSPDKVIVSESGGPLSAYYLANGELAWRLHPDSGSHFLSTGYNRSTNNVYGVRWSFEKGGPMVLHTINSSSGTITGTMQLCDRTTNTVFCRSGKYLVASTGDIYALDDETPKIIKTLAWDSDNA